MKTLIALCFVSFFISGCASIINGTTQKISTNSNPPGAKAVAVGGEKTVECVTPCTLVLKRKYSQTVTLSKDGFKPQTVTLTSATSGAVAGNILAGGLIGWGVDAASGGDSKLVPEAISVKLEEDKPAEPVVAAKEPPTPTQSLDAALADIDKMRDDGKITEKEAVALRKKAIEKF